MASDAERLNIIIAARDREFSRVMTQVTRRLERFERQGTRNLSKVSRQFNVLATSARALSPILAALGAGAIIGRLRAAVSALDDIGKTADKLGLTTDALQELRAVAESAGVSSNTLDMAMQRFGRRVAEARQGTGEAVKALKEMGITLTDASGRARSIDDVLGDVADRMAGMTSQTDRNRLAMKLFDSEGVVMVNLLREGAAGMEKMRADARALGIVIDEDLIRGAEGAQTQLDLMSRVVSANLNSALIELAPLLVGAARELANWARAISDLVGWVDRLIRPHDELQAAVDNVTLAMGDEIRQSQLLRATMGEGQTMTLSVARAKLEEARARRENLLARADEAAAAVRETEVYKALSASIAKEIRTLEDLGLALAAVNDADLQADNRRRGINAERREAIGRLNALERERLRLTLAVDAAVVNTNGEVAKMDGLIAALVAAIDDARGGIVTMGDSLTEPVELSERLSATLGGLHIAGLPEAKALAGYLRAAAAAAAQINATGGGVDPTSLGFAGVDGVGDPTVGDASSLTFGDTNYGPRNRTVDPLPPIPGGGGGGGGGGGSSPADEETNRLLSERDRILKDLETATEKYQKSVDDLNKLHEMGELSSEQYSKAMAKVREEMMRSEFGEVIRGIDGVADALADAIVNGKDLGESLGQVFRQIASDLISSGIKSALMQAFGFGGGSGGIGGILGGLFGGKSGFSGALFGGGRAAGGPVEPGRIYRINENTPNSEFFAPGMRGRVLTPGQVAGAMGGSRSSGGRSEVVVRLAGFPEGVTFEDVRHIAGDVAITVTAAGMRRQQSAFGAQQRSLHDRGTST